MAKYPKEKQQKEMEEDNKVHDSKSPEQILKELIDAYAKDKTVKKPVPSISQFEQGKFRRKTQPYQGEKPEKAQKSEKVEKNIGLPLMTSEKEEAQKAEDKKYPKKLGAKNVEAHMKRLKETPSKYPGGKKQAIAIGLSQAREGTKEPMPKAELDEASILKELKTRREKNIESAKKWSGKDAKEMHGTYHDALKTTSSKSSPVLKEKIAQLEEAHPHLKNVQKAGEMPSGAAKPKMPKMPSAPVMPSKQPMAAAQKQAQASASGKQMMPKMPKPPKTPKMATKSEEIEKKDLQSIPKKGVDEEKEFYYWKTPGKKGHFPRTKFPAGSHDEMRLVDMMTGKYKMHGPKGTLKSEEAVIKNEFIITEAELNNKCTDCNKPQFTLTKNEHKFTPCICYASENQGKEPFVKLVKSEGSTKLYFNSKADPESVKSFLLTLKLGLLAKKISK